MWFRFVCCCIGMSRHCTMGLDLQHACMHEKWRHTTTFFTTQRMAFCGSSLLLSHYSYCFKVGRTYHLPIFRWNPSHWEHMDFVKRQVGICVGQQHAAGTEHASMAYCLHAFIKRTPLPIYHSEVLPSCPALVAPSACSCFLLLHPQ